MMGKLKKIRTDYYYNNNNNKTIVNRVDGKITFQESWKNISSVVWSDLIYLDN